ncbi:hypothetical protein Tco_1543504, partial [Tanacetum coccineum]
GLTSFYFDYMEVANADGENEVFIDYMEVANADGEKEDVCLEDDLFFGLST